MVLVSLVASHSNLDLETVARLSEGASQVASRVLEDQVPVKGAVVLSTCNRYEIYVEAETPQDVHVARDAVVQHVAEASGLEISDVTKALDTKINDDAVAHLFSVGAGLDSAVIGEREIAGQVRRALIEAQDSGTASGSLVRLFQTASRTAKDVGTKTSLGSRGLSIVSVALDLADDLDSRALQDKKVVVFGTGAYAGATMALLRELGVKDVSVFSQTGRAESFVESRGGVALDAMSLGPAILDADVLVGCSGGGQQISAADVIGAAEREHPLVLVDLALSHDFDPNIDQVAGVHLISLESVRMAAPTETADAVRAARRIVDEATSEFAMSLKERSADSAIVALRKHTMSVLDEEINKVRAQHGCTAAAEEVEFAMRRMVKQLLHIPTVRGRELAAQGRADEYAQAIETLYGITIAEKPATPADRKAATVSEDPTAAECPVDHRLIG